MAFSRVAYPNLTGLTAVFGVPFTYLDRSHVHVYRVPTGLRFEEGAEEVTGYQWTAPSQITLPFAPTDVTLEIRRTTPADRVLGRLSSGTLSSAILNLDFTQMLYLAQEAADAATDYLARALVVPTGETGALLPTRSTRAGKALAFNGSGDPIAVALSLAGGVDPSSTALLDLIPYLDSTAGSLSRSARVKMGDWINGLDRGILTGTSPATLTQNYSAFTTLFGTPSRGRILLDGGTYTFSGALAFSLSNVWVRGIPGKTRLRTVDAGVVLGMTAFVADVVFEDIIFESTQADVTENVYGLLSILGGAINVRFYRCKFTAPSSGCNGIKIIADTDAISVDRVKFYECEVMQVGRAGFEVQNHPADNADFTPRYSEVVYEGGQIRSCGLAVPFGPAVSLSGSGRTCSIDTLIDDVTFAGIENVGASSSRFSGTMRNLVRPLDPLSFTGFRPMEDNTISGLRVLSEAAGSVLLRLQTRLRSRNNIFRLAGGVKGLNNADCLSTDESFVCRGDTALYHEGNSSTLRADGNRWGNLLLDHSGAVDAFAGVRFNGTSAKENAVEGVTYRPASSGVPFDQLNGASENFVRRQRPTETIYGAVQPDADTDWTTATLAPTLFGPSAVILSGTLTAPRTATLPRGFFRPGRVRNDSSQTLNVKVGGGAAVPIPAGSAKTIAYLGGTTVGEI